MFLNDFECFKQKIIVYEILANITFYLPTSEITMYRVSSRWFDKKGVRPVRTECQTIR